MKDRKLIFFDIDGTLITEEKNPRVPESTLKALEMLRANGHVCIINTGRPYASLDDLIRSINVDGYVCGCGSSIRMDGEILFFYQLEQSLCTSVVCSLDECGIEWMLEGENAVYYTETDYTSIIGPTVESLREKISGRIHKVTEADYGSIRFEKFLAAGTENSDFEKFRSRFENDFTFIVRREGFYEVIPKKCSKATGMKFLEEYLGIGHRNTFAVGDSTNDISMLEYAETGILMGGADENLKKHADYVTTSINDDGIFNAFRHFGLI